MHIVLVPGTKAWNGEKIDWYSPGSLFVTYLASKGISLLDPDHPFVWSTDIGGIGFGKGDQLVWKAAGVNLYQYLIPPRCQDRRVPPNDTIVLSHSHGLQVVLFAAAHGLKIKTFVDVAGPVRHDMMETARVARRNIRHWVHIHAGPKDYWQWLGELFDGKIGIVRQHELADVNLEIKDANHGDALRNPKFFPLVGDVFNER